MDSNYYQIYMDANLALAKSIVIKSSATADAINENLVNQYGSSIVDPANPQGWKYYLNLAGQYHPTDTVMQVVSLDTLQTINFTTTNLQHHKATAEAYAYGSTMYLELVNKFPTQEALIRGVLYPCDLTTAINAEDGTILAYPPFLVEDFEYSLIQNLQKWIYEFLSRWNNQQFVLSDNLYSAALIGILYLNLVPALLTLRLKACKTNEAHSYHIRQYLASHGMLDVYLRYLSRDQTLFLYRNIAYIERNSGKQAVFDWLVEHIMTPSNLPIAAYEMRHDVSVMPQELKPLLSFQKLPLNTKFNYDMKDAFTLKNVFDKEQILARDNERYQDDEMESSARKMSYSLSNRLKTKLLESSVVDYQGSEHYTLADTLLYEWIHLSSKHLYTAYVNFESPASGENLSLTAADAFTFYVYAQCATLGIPLLKVPTVMTKRVIRNPLPSLEELMSVVDAKRVSVDFAESVRNMIPNIPSLISVSSFYNYCLTLQRAAVQQYRSACAEPMDQTKAQKMNLVSRMWSDSWVQVGDHEDQFYADWFTSRNINIEAYTQDQLAIVANLILTKATGVDAEDQITLQNIQKQLVSLMKTLSSYSIQFVTSINTLPVVDVPTATLRPDNIHASSSGHDDIPFVIDVLRLDGVMKKTIDYDIGAASAQQVLTTLWQDTQHIDPTVKISKNESGTRFKKNLDVRVGITYDVEITHSNPHNVTPVLGTDLYLGLTPEQQATIPDAWVV